MLDKVELDPKISGSLWRSAMPGRYRDLAEDCKDIVEAGVSVVLRLTSLEELQKKSPDYASLLANGRAPWEDIAFPIPDFGIPSDVAAFASVVADIAARLRRGENILVHCGAGIGRTGLTIGGILVTLGMGLEEALALAAQVGARPETPTQKAFLRNYANGRHQ